MIHSNLIKNLAMSAALMSLVLYLEIAEAQQSDEELMKALETSYIEASQNSASVWLNFKETCYVYLYRGGGKPNGVLASFDIDDTLIKPKSNNKLPKNATDWQFLSDWTKVRVEQVTRGDKARLLVFSNQMGVSCGRVTLADIQKRVELIAEGLGVPCTVFIAINRDEFRKPGTGMFHLFEQSFKGPVEIDYERSFYCGDAIGYPAFSDSDLKFAQALGMPFISADDFLLDKTPKLVETN